MVDAGQEVEIMRNGEPVARLMPAGPERFGNSARTVAASSSPTTSTHPWRPRCWQPSRGDALPARHARLALVADDAGAAAPRGGRTARRPDQHAAALGGEQLGDRYQAPPRQAFASGASRGI